VAALTPTAIAAAAHMTHLVDQLHKLEERLRAGGGPDKIEKQHRASKLTSRERLARLLDRGAYVQEIGLLIAYDRYSGHAPAAGVVTGVGQIEGRPRLRSLFLKSSWRCYSRCSGTGRRKIQLALAQSVRLPLRPRNYFGSTSGLAAEAGSAVEFWCVTNDWSEWNVRFPVLLKATGLALIV
jgi:hypothetical protein